MSKLEPCITVLSERAALLHRHPLCTSRVAKGFIFVSMCLKVTQLTFLPAKLRIKFNLQLLNNLDLLLTGVILYIFLRCGSPSRKCILFVYFLQEQKMFFTSASSLVYANTVTPLTLNISVI